ncbi:hypothetical protein ACF08B_30860 [Streptomyces sp. NPDC015139]|uniref:hypothetical protein n=1 Tax=Streptomyces sp. NPDC015139 TaxID=3364942 RepID=UPI0036F857ED
MRPAGLVLRLESVHPKGRSRVRTARRTWPGTATLPRRGASRSPVSRARMLANDAGRHGFLGAAPPPGEAPHRCMFVVHALDTPRLDITTEATPRGSASGSCPTVQHERA